jgi:uncharacterized protein YgbK (DUF1537 family)
MIAVIADDITGGAEIAGIGFRYGLRVELSTRYDIPFPDVDLWVISTDSRSMSWEDAFVITVQTVETLKSHGIENIFKKTDSVLRGHIAAELVAQLKAEGKKKVILCPANPALGRKIINGIYYIDGIPLHETSFATDPDFRVQTSNVIEIVGSDLLCELDLFIADASSQEDLSSVAGQKNDETILAGSAAFFCSFLDSMGCKPTTCNTVIPLMKEVLFVRGSAFSTSRNEVKLTASTGAHVTYLSPLIINTPDNTATLNKYALELVGILRRGENAILAVGAPVLLVREATVTIKNLLAEVVSKVLSEVKVHELVIEGGATSTAILAQLNYYQFVPVFEYAPGIVRMKVKGEEELYVTIKPGSYQFPSHVWCFNNNN